jgi:hypothetical protein
VRFNAGTSTRVLEDGRIEIARPVEFSARWSISASHNRVVLIRRWFVVSGELSTEIKGYNEGHRKFPHAKHNFFEKVSRVIRLNPNAHTSPLTSRSNYFRPSSQSAQRSRIEARACLYFAWASDMPPVWPGCCLLHAICISTRQAAVASCRRNPDVFLDAAAAAAAAAVSSRVLRLT